VVRVQAGRLRSKLLEYYATEGKDDKVIIDLPKGHYIPVFSYARTITQPVENGLEEAGTNGVTNPAFEAKTNQGSRRGETAAPFRTEESAAERQPAIASLRLWLASLAGFSLITLSLGAVAYYYRGQALELQQLVAADAVKAGNPIDRQNALIVWGSLLS